MTGRGGRGGSGEPFDLAQKLRTAKEWLNGGECCGQVDSGGTCAAPACIFGEACKWMHAAAEALGKTPPRDGAEAGE